MATPFGRKCRANPCESEAKLPLARGYKNKRASARAQSGAMLPAAISVLLVLSSAVSAQLLPWGSLYERFQPVPVPSTELQPPPPPSEPEGDLQPPPISFDDDAKPQLFTITEESSVEPSTEKAVSVEETGDEVIEVLKIVPKSKAYPKKYRPELHKQQEGEVKKNYSPKQHVVEQETAESTFSGISAGAGGDHIGGGFGGDGNRVEFQMHGMNGPHSYKFGYDTGKGHNRQFRYEERDTHGHVKGHYGFYDKHGKLQVVNYSADPHLGYHAEGSFGSHSVV